MPIKQSARFSQVQLSHWPKCASSLGFPGASSRSLCGLPRHPLSLASPFETQTTFTFLHFLYQYFQCFFFFVLPSVFEHSRSSLHRSCKYFDAPTLFSFPFLYIFALLCRRSLFRPARFEFWWLGRPFKGQHAETKHKEETCPEQGDIHIEENDTIDVTDAANRSTAGGRDWTKFVFDSFTNAWSRFAARGRDWIKFSFDKFADASRCFSTHGSGWTKFV